ncbi:MAG: hypothetical protein WA160_02035 [Pseudobdellovibrio sp.]
MNSFLDNPSIKTKSDKVRHFIKDVGLPLNQAPSALGVTASEFMTWWSGRKSKLVNTKQLIQLSQFLNLDENEIMSGTYDKEFVRSILFSGGTALPQKYSQNQFSFLRSSAHIVKFLTLTRGQHFSDMIMRKMNISPIIYGNLNNKISLNYFTDLLEVLAQNGLTQSELDNLACVLFLSIEGTLLGEQFKKAKNHYECYQVLANNVHLFDSNFSYTFEFDRNQMRASAYLDFEKHSHTQWSHERLQRLLRYRQLLIGWYSYLSNLPPLFPECTVKVTKQGIDALYVVKFKDQSANSLYPLPKIQSI